MRSQPLFASCATCISSECATNTLLIITALLMVRENRKWCQMDGFGQLNGTEWYDTVVDCSTHFIQNQVKGHIIFSFLESRHLTELVMSAKHPETLLIFPGIHKNHYALCSWIHLPTQTASNQYIRITPTTNSAIDASSPCAIYKAERKHQNVVIGQTTYSEAYFTAVSCSALAHVSVYPANRKCSQNVRARFSQSYKLTFLQ